MKQLTARSGPGTNRIAAQFWRPDCTGLIAKGHQFRNIFIVILGIKIQTFFSCSERALLLPGCFFPLLPVLFCRMIKINLTHQGIGRFGIQMWTFNTSTLPALKKGRQLQYQIYPKHIPDGFKDGSPSRIWSFHDARRKELKEYLKKSILSSRHSALLSPIR